jgi:hypothetical protein
MSTANFLKSDYFPLVAVEYYFDSSEEIPEEMSEDTTYLTQVDVTDIEDEIDVFSTDLNFIKVELIDGYFEGVQLYASFIDDNYLKYPLVSGDDSDEEFAQSAGYESAADFMKAVKAEYRKVTDFMSDIADAYNMSLLDVAAVFSNGEAIYKKVN